MTLQILEIIFPIFAIVFIGLVYGKRFSPDMSLPNRLNIDVFIPALLFAVLTRHAAQAGFYLDLALAAILVVIGSGLITWPITKLLKIDPKTLCPPMMFVNAGNMGLPLMVMAFGEQAFPAAVVVFLIGNFLHISLGSYILDHRSHILDVITSPMMIAVMLAILVSVLGITLPATVMKPIELLGQICVPLMLFSLGVRLADVNFSDWRLGILATILCPLVGTLLVLILLPFFEMTKTQQGVLFMFGALPPAVLNFMFAEHYDQEPDRVAAIVLISNAFALITIPLALVYALPKFGL
ncbi:MAG: AEC family transporter [Gammaproteobacteria bacterium]